MTDHQALALDEVLQSLPRDDAFRYRKAVVTHGPTEVMTGERSDVSWISTEDPDRSHEVVLARGMNDTHYKLNPIVTMQHSYDMPPVGRSLWRKVVRDGRLCGVKAKTVYPPCPESWSGTWPPDAAFALIRSGLLRGKSIGFLPTKVSIPDEVTCARNGWGKVDLVIEEWVLLEYACTFLPAQQNAVVEAVSKSAIEIPEPFLRLMGLEGMGVRKWTVPYFTPLEEIEKHLLRSVESLDMKTLTEKIAQRTLDQLRGRV